MRSQRPAAAVLAFASLTAGCLSFGGGTPAPTTTPPAATQPTPPASLVGRAVRVYFRGTDEIPYEQPGKLSWYGGTVAQVAPGWVLLSDGPGTPPNLWIPAGSIALIRATDDEPTPAPPPATTAPAATRPVAAAAPPPFALTADTAVSRLMSTRYVAALVEAVPSRRLTCMADGGRPGEIDLYLGDDEVDHTTRIAFCRVTADGRAWANRDPTGLDDRWVVVE